MKSFLMIYALFTILEFIKIFMVGFRIEREYIKTVKVKKSFMERLLTTIYYGVLLLLPPLNITILSMSEDEMVKRIAKDMVKKDA